MTTVVPSGLGVAVTSPKALISVEPRPRSMLGPRSRHCPWSRTSIRTSSPRHGRGDVDEGLGGLLRVLDGVRRRLRRGQQQVVGSVRVHAGTLQQGAQPAAQHAGSRRRPTAAATARRPWPPRFRAPAAGASGGPARSGTTSDGGPVSTTAAASATGRGAGAARAPAGRPFQRDPHTRDQLRRLERLGQVVVGAGVEALDRGLLAGARGQHDHRDAGAWRGRRGGRAAARSRRPAASSRR